MNANIVIDNIITRASVRQYEKEHSVEYEKIQLMLRAGMAAPSILNKQAWHFVVVIQREILDQLAVACPNSAMVKNAPLAIIVCGDMARAQTDSVRQYWIQECSAATQNILLAAHALGLGAVWTGVYPVWKDESTTSDRCRETKKVLHIPSHLIPLNILVIGYPNKEVKPKDKFKEECIFWNTFGEK